MESKGFKLNIKEIDGVRVINFKNNTENFVEVIFAIDGKEVKNGLPYSPELKGYAYPPRLEKEVKRMKNGKLLPFRLLRSGKLTAHIFRGTGSYYDEDLDKPTFLRHRLVKSIKFKRVDQEPYEVMEVEY